jgi:hypothetical protein
MKLAAVPGLIGLMDFGNCGEPCGSETVTFPGGIGRVLVPI